MDTQFREKQDEFLELLRPHKSGLQRFCRALSKDAESGKDLASETILITYDRFDALKNKESIKSYLYTVASRLARDERKLAKHNTQYDEASSIEFTGTSSDVLVDIHFLQEAMQKLSEKTRNSLIMFEISGYSLEEIREIQGGSLSGVKLRLLRGRKELGKLLGAKVERKEKSEAVVNNIHSILTSIIL